MRARAHADALAVARSECEASIDYEKLVEATYRRILTAGDTAVDIGAHSGRHTAPLSELVGAGGKVFAFEPLPDVFKYLSSRQIGDNVRFINAAVSDFSGRSDFVFARGAPEESGLRLKRYNFPESTSPETIDVSVTRLDDYVDELRGLRYIKIDVEGAEIRCIQGAAQCLRTYRPFISVEYGFPGYSAFGNTKRTLFDIARRFGYVLYDLFGSPIRDLSTWKYVCNRAYWDWLMVPKERVPEWQKLFAAPLVY